ncbi:MAG: phenylacetate--CoA ligase family protein [bacterium]
MHKFDFYPKIVRNLIAPLWALKEGSPYLKHLRYLEKSQYFPISQVKENQWKRFKALLSHAYENCDFYRERLAKHGIEPDDIKAWKDLSAIPILNKDHIRNNKDKMIAKNIPCEKIIPKKTSGSTGVSLEFFVDIDSLQWKRACAIRHDQWTGWKMGERIGAVWGNPEYKKSWRGYVRNFLLERYDYLDTLKMDEKDMLEFYHCIRKKNISLLFGHAHSLYLFVRFLKKQDLNGVKPKGIISTAMVLHDFERAEIEHAFNCKVTNRYGCEEVSLIACECEEHDGFHINMDTVIVEIIHDGKKAISGEPGAIVITDLTNYGMPFIRYKVGDVGILSDRFCPCGRSYPLLESIKGRASDYIMTPDGKLISGISLTENFAMLISGIKQIQIIQEQLDCLVLKIVKSENFSIETEKQIHKLFVERFGSKMRYRVDLVNSIQIEHSGKYRFCVSKLGKEFF